MAMNVNVPQLQKPDGGLIRELLPTILSALLRRKDEAGSEEAYQGLAEFLKEKDAAEVKPAATIGSLSPAPGEQPIPMAKAAPTQQPTPKAYPLMEDLLKPEAKPEVRPQWQQTQVQLPKEEPKPRILPPKGQQPSFYGAVAANEMGLKTPTTQLIQTVDETGAPVQKFVPKQAGAVHAPAPASYQGKPTVLRNEDGSEKGLYYVYTNPKDPASAPIIGGEVRDPMDVAVARGESFASSRAKYQTVPTVDTETNKLGFTSQYELSQKPFGERAPVGPYVTAAKARSFTEAIRADVNAARESINRMGNFTPIEAAQLEKYMGNPDNPKDIGSIEAFFRNAVGHTLTRDQLLYVVRLNSLIETSMSLRVIQGQGAGAEDQRRAIRLMLPNGTSVTKEFANEMLNSVETTVAGVEMGIMQANLNPPALITDENGLVPAGVTNQMWGHITNQLRAKGFEYDPAARMWRQTKAGGQQQAPTMPTPGGRGVGAAPAPMPAPAQKLQRLPGESFPDYLRRAQAAGIK